MKVKPWRWNTLGYQDRLALLRSYDFTDLCEPDESNEDVRRRLARQPWEELTRSVQVLMYAEGARA